jgi:hypothetical protein
MHSSLAVGQDIRWHYALDAHTRLAFPAAEDAVRAVVRCITIQIRFARNEVDGQCFRRRRIPRHPARAGADREAIEEAIDTLKSTIHGEKKS